MNSQSTRLFRLIPACAVWGLALVLMAAGVAPAFAQDGEEEIVPTGLPPLSQRTAVLSFPISVLGNENSQIPIPRLQEIESVTIMIEDFSEDGLGIDISEDFLPLSSSALTSGIALYQESQSTPGVFSYAASDPGSDRPVDLVSEPEVQVDPTDSGRVFITFRPVPGTNVARIPLVQDSHADFHIVVQTTLNLRHGDTFEVSIPANGITIRDRINPLPDNTVYDDPFPGDAFGALNSDFAQRQIYQGDIVQIVNMIKETDNSFRIDANSQGKAILGFDLAGRQDEGYFIREVKVNFYGLNLAAINHLITTAIGRGFGMPTFFYNPFFYNFPEDPDNPGMIWMEQRNVGLEEPVEYPKTMPLTFFGTPREAFFIGNDNLESQVLSYVPYGPRPFGSDGLEPTRLTNQDIFLKPLASGAGGFFLYREIGGQPSQFDVGVDRVFNLDDSQLRIEPFSVAADEVNENPALQRVLQRMLPGVVGGDTSKRMIPWLFQDSDLPLALLGTPASVFDGIDPESLDNERPPLGSLECYFDEDCFLFDQLINVSRPFLGLTEGQIRYLVSLSGNDKSNLLDLYNFELIQGFTVTLPVSRDNAVGDLRAPITRTGNDFGPDIFLGVRTSERLRSLDAVIPFIQPGDITVGTQLAAFTQGATDTSNFGSVSSAGLGRKNSDTTFPLIGRPSPRFTYRDLTQAGEGINASNNNIIFDRTLSSPPKPVIGIDGIDFGQNPNLVFTSAGFNEDLFDTFHNENVVLSQMQIEFLPGVNTAALFSLFSLVPAELFVTFETPFVASAHSVALYEDDDTPTGDFIDNDGDGLIDEEWYNLQDDDGDGLIDEDLGDGSPAGINGVFDSNDDFLPIFTEDRWGAMNTPRFVFPPNNITRFEDYIGAIEPDDEPFELEQGQVLPLSVGENSWFAELDFRALGNENYEVFDSDILPSRFQRPFGTAGPPDYEPPRYNWGYYNGLDPRTGVLDLFSLLNPQDLITEDLFLEDVLTGELQFMITIDPGDDTIPLLQDPDEDPLRSMLLSFAAALRIPNPLLAFVKVGRNPMVVDVGDELAANALDPIGPNQPDPPVYTQFGHYITVTEPDTLGDYIADLRETIGDAVESALEAIDDYNNEVADAEAECDEDPECTEPEYPEETPDPIEISPTDPYEALGINDFFGDDPIYQTSYMYQIQVPDENFGPLAGDDWFVVLRTSPLARVGDSFRVRMRSGQLGRQLTTFNADDGTIEVFDAPEGGIAYHSHLDVNYLESEPFRNISKNQITTDEIFVQSQNVSPQVAFQSPTAGQNTASSNFTFQISYVVTDPDSSPQVSLFVDTNSLGFDGDFIPGSQVRPTPGVVNSFTLNLTDDIPDFDPTLEYFVYARVDDGVNSPVFAYADGPIVTTARSSGGGGGGGSSGGGGQIVVEGSSVPNQFDYAKLTSDGRSFSLGDLPGLGIFTETEPVVDMEPNIAFNGMIGVQRNGTVLASGDVGIFLANFQENGTLAFPNGQRYFLDNDLAGANLIANPTSGQIQIEMARDIEVDYVNGAIYVLDGDGDMLYLGAADTSLRPDPVGMDVYRDMELHPRGDDIYFLAGNGVLTRASQPGQALWSNLQEDVNTYVDIELYVSGTDVGNVIVVDNTGDLSITGSGAASGIEGLPYRPLFPGQEVTPGAVRQVKLFPGEPDMYILVEGSGQVHYFSDTELDPLETPDDPFVFADTPGLDDDIVVDLETGNVNLQSVVETVREIILAYNNEDISTIVGHAAPDYFDRNGADLRGLNKSLETIFQFGEVRSYSEANSQPNSFVVTNEGDTVRASVLLNYSYYTPEVRYRSTEIETGATAPESLGFMFFTDQVAGLDQRLRLREVLDGRAWLIDVYLIQNFGRSFDENFDNEDPEFEIIRELTRLPGNTLVGTYAPKKIGPDKPMFFEVPGLRQFSHTTLLFVLREQFLTRDRTAPVMEITWYPGSFLAALGFDRVEFIFKRSDDGSFRMTSMSQRMMIAENDRDFEFTTGIDEPILGEIDDLEVEQPFGFSFKDRGPVITSFFGGADVVVSGDSLLTTDPRSGIMMLPENTDIFALNPETLLQQISRTDVLFNPFDPGDVDSFGQSASIQPGRAYFVILSDGKGFGLLQLPEDVFTPDDFEIAPVLFDYRYEDSFILPEDF